MERNELTTAKQLKPGDRFYKKADKSKKVYQMVEGKKAKFVPFHGMQKLLCCEVSVIDTKMHGSAKEEFFKTILNDVEVIYLRSNL